LTSLSRDFQAAQPGGGGTVRLAVGEVLAAKIVAPSVAAFHERYPHLELEVMADAAAVGGGIAPRVAVPLKDVDMAIRAARPTQGDMIMRKLGDMAYGLYGSKAYLQEHGHPQELSDLAGHSLIGFSRNDSPFGPIWWMSRAEKVGEIAFRSSSAAARARAVLDSNGLAVLPCVVGDVEPEMDRVFGPDIVGSLELWLLTRNDLAQQAHVRAVMEFMVEVVRRARSELEGDPRRLTELPPK
jgi:DNA-binding transcriptional LysR family regulator